MLVLEATEFGHRGDELVGSERSHASDAGEDLVSAGECCIGGDQVGDLSVERFDMPIDLVKPLPTLALEKSDGEVFLAVFERGAITRQTVAGIDQFGHLGLLRAARRPDRRLEGGSHAGQQHGVDAISLGERACGLGKAPSALRVEFDAGSIGQRGLQRPVVGRGRLIGYPLDLPLPEPGDQSLVTFGGVGKLALCAGGKGVAIEARFGDVDADGLC